MNKLKVCMVCHFSNAKVRECLPLDNRKLYNFIRKLFRMPTNSNCYVDVAAWDTYIIERLRRRDDIELHVISAHTGLKRRVIIFDLEGVHYFFVRCEGATILKRLIISPTLWHKLNPMRPIVRKIVYKINPDIIALIGAENAYLSGTVLGIRGYPLIVKCQTIYNNPNRKLLTSAFDKKNAYVERLIFEQLKYVSVTSKMHEPIFRTMNKTAINFMWRLGNILPNVKPLPKEFDFVIFAMHVIPSKGYTDIVDAMNIVHKNKSNVTLNIIGDGTPEYMDELRNLIKNYGLEENVSFTPTFSDQSELFQHLQRSKYAVLPCKLDSIASTIRQAMYYELPVVCYQTMGTITLNQNKECVLIAKNGDVSDLAEKMLILLNDEEKATELRKNAKEYTSRWNDDEKITTQMVDNFRAIVANYRYGTPVPERLQYKEQ